MITTLEEAKTHANHAHLGRFKYVVVLPDGGIYAGNDKEKAESLLEENHFIVKGELSLPTKTKKVKKEIE